MALPTSHTRARTRTLAVLAALGAASLGGACKRTEDQAAKRRIFSPEQPSGVAAEALEKLDAHQLASDPALAERILRMRQSEIAERLSAHKTDSKVSFAWHRGPEALLPDGGVDPSLAIALTEDTTLAQAPGGDFAIEQKNDHNRGFALVRAQGGVYSRGLFGSFHKRRTDRTDPNAIRDQALGALATFDRLARGLKLRLVGDVRSSGRSAVEYAVIGSGGAPKEERSTEVGPPTYPEPPAGQAGKALGPDPDTARRLDLRDKEQPASVSGNIFIDAATAAPLAADLKGVFRVAPNNPNNKDAPPAELALSISFETTAVGSAVAVKVPAFEPDPSAPHGVKDPLRFLGKAAVAGAPSTEDATEEEDTTDSDTDAPDTADAKPEKPAAKPTTEKPKATPAPTKKAEKPE